MSVAMGTGLAAMVYRLLRGLLPASALSALPFLQDLGFSSHLAEMLCTLSVCSIILLAITPTLRAPLSGIRKALSEGGRHSGSLSWRRLGSTLAVAELAIAVVLLVGAGLLVRSVQHLMQIPLGFDPNNLATFSVAALDGNYATPADQRHLADRIKYELVRVPGVLGVGMGSSLPVSFNGNTDWIRFTSRPYDGKHIEVNARTADVGYFPTLHAKLIRGRFFDDGDDASKPPVAVVNQKFVKQFFRSEDPIGKRFGDTDLTPASIKEIVGVVDDVHEGALTDPI